jgi:membrane dipeptidase
MFFFLFHNGMAREQEGWNSGSRVFSVINRSVTIISIFLAPGFKNYIMTKRFLPGKMVLALSSVLFLITFPCSGKQHPDPSPEKVKRIHEKALTVDTHCDTPMDIVNEGTDIGKVNPKGKVDLPRMKEGGLDAIFFAAFTGQKSRTEENYREVYHLANQLIDSTYSAVGRYPELAEIALSSKDARRIEKSGKRAIYIGMENGFPLAKDITRVREFYDRGVRYITLCHSFNNDICDSSTDRKGPEHNGLSPFGREVVKEMNRVGMIIDVSHISDKSFFDVLEVSKAPVIASHSSVRAIAHHNRNLSDDMIKALAAKGGVIQICLLDEYVKDPDVNNEGYKKMADLRKSYYSRWDSLTEADKAEFRRKRNEIEAQYPAVLPVVKDYVDHIDHVVRLVGIDYVGIGSDFDGGGGLTDCQDVSQFPNITRELLKRGYTPKQIYKIWGGNFFRVFREVEKKAEKMTNL